MTDACPFCSLPRERLVAESMHTLTNPGRVALPRVRRRSPQPVACSCALLLKAEIAAHGRVSRAPERLGGASRTT
jgi:hypothetical protein